MPVRVHPTDTGVVVRMPPPHAVSQALIALSWVPFVAIAAGIAWVVGAGTIPRLTTSGPAGFLAGVFLLVFVLVIVLIVLFGFMGAIYGLVGAEVARVEGGDLILERVLFGAKQRQRYRGVENLRLAPGNIDPQQWRSSPPRLLFDWNGHPQAFGAGLTDDEAEQVLAALRSALG